MPLDIVRWTERHARHADLVDVLRDFLPRASQANLDVAAQTIGTKLYELQWESERRANPTLAHTRDRLATLIAALNVASSEIANALADGRAAKFLHDAADPPLFGPPALVVPPDGTTPADPASGIDFGEVLRRHAEDGGVARWAAVATHVTRAHAWAQRAAEHAEGEPQGRRSKLPLSGLTLDVANLWALYSRRNNRGYLLQRFSATRNKRGPNDLIAQLVGVAGVHVAPEAINEAVRDVEKANR